MDELAAADVDPDVAEPVEEDEVAGLQVAHATGTPIRYCAYGCAAARRRSGSRRTSRGPSSRSRPARRRPRRTACRGTASRFRRRRRTARAADAGTSGGVEVDADVVGDEAATGCDLRRLGVAPRARPAPAGARAACCSALSCCDLAARSSRARLALRRTATRSTRCSIDARCTSCWPSSLAPLSCAALLDRCAEADDVARHCVSCFEIWWCRRSADQQVVEAASSRGAPRAWCSSRRTCRAATSRRESAPWERCRFDLRDAEIGLVDVQVAVDRLSWLRARSYDWTGFSRLESRPCSSSRTRCASACFDAMFPGSADARALEKSCRENEKDDRRLTFTGE